ncbi:MAG: nuclear transport factor 2 family protein [Bacteroidetes bacterium]|nr:nuclear transport factor 2 family protein [Bacteroidota bacterium]
MRKAGLSCLFILFLVNAVAQPAVDDLLKTENSFAAYALAHGTKEAFLLFADSNGIVFSKGKPVNALESWAKREKSDAVLKWHPVFAETAASGDFGYTTGPWSYQPGPQDSAIAYGYFITIWHRNENGEWKFLLDLGISNDPGITETGIKKINNTKFYKNETEESVRKAENNFIKAYAKKGTDAYGSYITERSRLNRNGGPPAITDKERFSMLYETPDSISYAITGSGISSSHDLGYVYGTLTVKGKADNYLRIWRKEKTGWKIALEVARW